MKAKKIYALLAAACCSLIFCGVIQKNSCFAAQSAKNPVYATEQPKSQQNSQANSSWQQAAATENPLTLLDAIDTTEADAFLKDILKEDLSFKDLIKGALNGQIPLSKETCWQIVSTVFWGELNDNKKSMISIFLLTALAALFTSFTRALDHSEAADISFYIIYLLLLAVLFKSFHVTEQIASGTLTQMTVFMKALLPIFFITVVAAKGGTTALVFYELILILIYVVNIILLNLLLPMCNVYVILNLVNQISKEDLFSKLCKLIRQIILWTLKTMFGVIIGINIVHSLLAPAIDGFKNGAFQKALSGIPGIGNTLGSMTDVMVGSGILIKNSVGVCIMALLALICLTPVVKLFVCMLMYKVTSALIQPISDKRMINCIETVADGAWLLMKCVITAMTLFFVTIAIVTVASG